MAHGETVEEQGRVAGRAGEFGGRVRRAGPTECAGDIQRARERKVPAPLLAKASGSEQDLGDLSGACAAMKPNRAAFMAGFERVLRTDAKRPVTKRSSLLSAEERLQNALKEIGRMRAELRFEAALLEIERLADKLSEP